MTSYAALDIPSLASLRRVLFLWAQVVSMARRSICATLQSGIRRGGVVSLTDPSGTYAFGHIPPDAPKRSTIEVTIHDESFWVRVYLDYDTGFSEAFMNQEFTTSDLKGLLHLFVDNAAYLKGLASPFCRLQTLIDIAYQRLSHGLTKSVDNVAGYDASNTLYKAFLSREMQYSCPIWGDDEGGPHGDLDGRAKRGDLEAAQKRKIAHVLAKARLRPGDRLLEIGSGWGSVAIAAARMGCTVDTLTLSTEQKALAEKRIREAGVEDKATVHLMDYRCMPPEFEKAFDACVSIEMLEAVGVEYMSTYISKIDWALKSDRAAVVLTATTYPEFYYQQYQANNFIRKYHWPCTVLESATSLADKFNSVTKGRLYLESITDFGEHYPRCLREWQRRFRESWETTLGVTLQGQYKELNDPRRLEIYRRRWEYMFTYMDVAYSRVQLSLHMWTFVRLGNAAVGFR